MTDPTMPVVMSTFAVGVGLFFMGKLWSEIWLHTRHTTLDADPALGASAKPPPVPLALRGSGVSPGPYSNVDLAMIGLLMLLFGYFTWSNLQVQDVRMDQVKPEGLVVSMVMQGMLAAMVVVWVGCRFSCVEWLGLRWPKWKSVFWLTPLTLLAVWGVMLTLMLILKESGGLHWLRSVGVETSQDSVKLLQEAQDPVVVSLMAVAAVVVAPICEELVFRGYFYPAMKHHSSPACAAIASALVFSTAHASLMALLPLFLLGLVFVWLYEKTGSIWAPIALHFAFNSATVALQLIARWYQWPIETP